MKDPDRIGRKGRSPGGRGKAIGIIPTRYASTRFPGKPLAPIYGKPMIQWVYERASGAVRLDRLLVATDDERIMSTVEGFGGDVVLTAADHPTGTDRCAEVALTLDCDVIVDIQGDEPLVDPELLDRLVDSLLDAPWASIATPMRRCASAREYKSPDCVKVVATRDGRILYFSRSPVPQGVADPVKEAFIHVGIYAFRRSSLLELGRSPRGELETLESLEQLRALEAGMDIRGIHCEGTFVGVDRPEDIEKVERLLEVQQGGNVPPDMLS